MNPEELLRLQRFANASLNRGASLADVDARLQELTGGEIVNMTALNSAVALAQQPETAQDAPPARTATSGITDFITQAAAGATFGGLDEIVGAINVLNPVSLVQEGGPAGAFREGRKRAKERLEVARERAGPAASLIGEGGGALLPVARAFQFGRAATKAPGAFGFLGGGGARAEQLRKAGVAGAQTPGRDFGRSLLGNVIAGAGTGAAAGGVSGVLGGEGAERVTEGVEGAVEGGAVGAALGVIPGLIGGVGSGLQARASRIQTRNPRIARELDDLTDEEFGRLFDVTRAPDLQALRARRPEMANALEAGLRVAKGSPDDITKAIAGSEGRARQVVRASVIRRAVEDISARGNTRPISLSDPEVTRVRTALTSLADDKEQAQSLFNEFADVVTRERTQANIEHIQEVTAKIVGFLGLGTSLFGETIFGLFD